MLVFIIRLYYNTRRKNIKSRKVCLRWTSLALLTNRKECGAHINKTNIDLSALLFSLLSNKISNLIHENRWKKNYIPIYIQQDETLHSLYISGNCCTCFCLYLYSSSGTQTTVSTESGTCQTVTATCRYRGRVGTAYSSNSSMIAAGSSNDLTSTRCCRYSCVCS